MPQPHITFVSPDETLAHEVNDLLTADAVFQATCDLAAAPTLLAPEDFNLLVADLRAIADGGHESDQQIDALQLAFPQAAMLVLVPEECPETLERRAACTNLVLHRGDVDAATIRDLIEQHGLLPAPTSAPDPVVRAPGNETFGEVTFRGATRHIETRSPEFKSILEDLAIAASHDVTILLIGETGSGKTFLSNLIHEASPRRNAPFLHVACGALPHELIESELFGHAKGSFTSAHIDKEGKFVAAGRGTILLDEIDVLPPEQQVKLLRVIETGEFEQVGSNQTLRSQARLVVASNLHLKPLVEQGRFRPDLYYRLSMLQFEIPPLRRRKVDIIPMAKKFIAQFQEKHQIAIHRIEDSVLDALLSYPWPGNVRELEHVIQRAVIYCRDGVLTVKQLPGHILSGDAGPANDPTVHLGGSASPTDRSLEQQVAVTEREVIEQALFKNNFSRTKTAKDLGISRVTLYNKMKKYDMLN